MLAAGWEDGRGSSGEILVPLAAVTELVECGQLLCSRDAVAVHEVR